MTQFIRNYSKVFSSDFCNKVIESFENANKLGLCLNRLQQDGAPNTAKDDSSFSLKEEYDVRGTLSQDFINGIKGYIENYLTEYSQLSGLALNIYTIKIQKTKVGGGYHVWHYENGGREVNNRVLAYTLYLNDVEEGGETEFLHQHLRIKPKMGDFCIFPCGFTHLHRGNPPISNDKYIITGWLEL